MATDKDKWIAETRFFMDFAVTHLRRTGSFAIMFQLHTVGGQIEIIGTEGGMANDPRAKGNISRAIRERIQRGDIEAVISGCDTYYANFDFERDPKAKEKMAMKEMLGLSVEQAAAIGLCDKGEALRVSLETRDGFQYSIEQIYMRNPDNQREIFLGERIEMDIAEADAHLMGRFTQWFKAVNG